MSERRLIVNADDCNLTPGVTCAILDCHDRGILTSTTFMINLPVTNETLRQLRRRPKLGVGLHMNVTFQKPVLQPQRIPTLVQRDGSFRRYADQTGKLPKFNELVKEYEAQILRFKDLFGGLPTHLDTHHQVHDALFFLKAVLAVAKKFSLPARRSRLMLTQAGEALYRKAGVKSPEFFFGNLTPEGYWRKAPLIGVLENLPAGTSEIMCHPGVHDKHLESVSSFREGRAAEYALLASRTMRELTKDRGIRLVHYGNCYGPSKAF